MWYKSYFGRGLDFSGAQKVVFASTQAAYGIGTEGGKSMMILSKDQLWYMALVNCIVNCKGCIIEIGLD